ncbi:unnamed protein product [Effrenium voratum]|nr:unnamed protein product [Effrenium voratum]
MALRAMLLGMWKCRPVLCEGQERGASEPRDWASTPCASRARSHSNRLGDVLGWLDRRARLLQAAGGLELIGDDTRAWEAFVELLELADFAEALPSAPSEARARRLGEAAAGLFDAFAAAPAPGDAWASVARNVLALDYAFALFCSKDARFVREALGDLGIQEVVDPMAGSGLHAQLLAREGLQVTASDSCTQGRLCWFPVAEMRLEELPVLGHPKAALFLCWPPHSDAADTALQKFGGHVLVLVGDRGKWHGSETFHQELQARLGISQGELGAAGPADAEALAQAGGRPPDLAEKTPAEFLPFAATKRDSAMPSETISVTAMLLDGREVRVVTALDSPVEGLRVFVGHQLGINSHRIQLAAGAEALNNERTIRECGLADDALLSVIVLPPLYGALARAPREYLCGEVMAAKMELHDALARAGRLTPIH